MTDSDSGPAQHERPVRVQTPEGAIDGFLRSSERLRTLDDLNLVAKHFLTIHAPTASRPERPLDDSPVSINKDSILFLHESAPPPPQLSDQPARQFARGRLRLRIGSFDVEGFVHVPQGGDALKRLNQISHAFIALTTVLITGPETETSTPFLAVNRKYISTAQELGRGSGEELAPVGGDSSTV